MTSRHRMIALALSLVAVGLAWGIWRGVESSRFSEGLAKARQLAAAGQFEDARRWLIGLSPARSAEPEVADLLGACEHAAGNYEAALSAWSRVAPDSPLAPRADLARAKTLAGDLGRFSDAEPLLESLVRVGGPVGVEARHTLSQLYFWQFRLHDMRRLTLAAWRNAPDPASELRDLWLIDDAIPTIDQVRVVIEDAARHSPDDDRVWLAQAGLDAATGRLDQAARRLEQCTERRPDDPAVWHARLEVARTREDEAGVRLALSRLPAGELGEWEELDFRAWLAARQGDRAAERDALERRAAVGPADTRPFERLAVMALEAGQADRAAEFRRRKTELDQAKDRYRRLLQDRAPTQHYEELARLAEVLDRRVEAEGWWTLAYRRSPGRSDILEALARLRPPAKGEPEVAGVATASRAAEASAPLSKAKAGGSARTTATPVAFRDDAEASGLKFVFENGRSPERQLPETTSGGIGLIDYDGDGWMDVYALQGGVFPPDTSRPSGGDRLFRNRGDGTFEDVTERSGIARLRGGYSHGIAVGDFDNDGHPDIFLTRWNSYALYRNRGDGTFEDATDQVGLGGGRDWPTSAAFADLDNDGDLDLYVCHYLVWDAEHPTLCPRKPSEAGMPGAETAYSYCMPNPFPALSDHLFRNDGGKFVDVTKEAGIVDTNGRGLGVVAADIDEDGLVDLFVANDTTANYLFHNLGGMKFEEVGFSNGVACNAQGAFQAGMGTACGDLDGDGRPDLLVTNFYGESTTFFRNLGGGQFADQTNAISLSAHSRLLLGFGINVLDANNDGRLDLATANGHVDDDRPNFPYDMPALLLLGTPGGRLINAARGDDDPWKVPRIGRGLATGDLDNDGRVDVLIVGQKSPLSYLHNGTKTSEGRSITFLLEGTKSNRDGVGAVVSVTSGGRRQRSWRLGGGSFQSASDPRLHFGIGREERVDEVEVRWPSGQVDHFTSLETDRGYKLREGGPTATPLPGPWQPRPDRKPPTTPTGSKVSP